MTDDLASNFDEHGNLTTAAVRHVLCYAVALVQRLIVPAHVHEDWPDFFCLVEAFVPLYGSPRLERLARVSHPFETDGNVPLTDGDRAFLVTLVADIYDLLKAREGATAA